MVVGRDHQPAADGAAVAEDHLDVRAGDLVLAHAGEERPRAPAGDRVALRVDDRPAEQRAGRERDVDLARRRAAPLAGVEHEQVGADVGDPADQALAAGDDLHRVAVDHPRAGHPGEVTSPQAALDGEGLVLGLLGADLGVHARAEAVEGGDARVDVLGSVGLRSGHGRDRRTPAAGGWQDHRMSADPASRWREQLEAWAIPDALLDAAPADPYALPPDLITTATVDPRDTPTGDAVLEAAPPGSRILDVGCGAGRISGTFTTDHEVVGVEPRAELAEVAAGVGIDVRPGRWPDVAAEVGTAEVVLSTHVAYDVQVIAPFLAALHGAAERRVVLEVTAVHPWTWIGPLYRRFHDLDRPDGPSAELLAEVVARLLGVLPEATSWRRPAHRYADRDALVAHVRRMLCLPADRDAEVADAVAPLVTAHPDGTASLPDRELVTMWWDTSRSPS